MKALRVFSMLTAAMLLFTLTAFAAGFTPSVEKEDIELISPDDDALILTPDEHLDDEDKDVHDDIEDAIKEAHDDFEEALQDLIDNFKDIWEEHTGGANVEDAIISDVFDLRYGNELGIDGTGVEIEFEIKVDGIGPDTVFVVITKPHGDDAWKVVNFTISEDGVITINGTTKTVYAIVRDKNTMPDGPDGPATGVPGYLFPAVAGVVVFGAAAVLCVRKVTKREDA